MSVVVEKLSRSFDGIKALEEVDLTVNKGEFICLLGKSGCGKSTLLKALSGLDLNYQGEIKVHGETLTGVRDDVGVIFQEPRLLPWLTVEKNILFGLKDKSDQTLTRARRFIDYVGLTGKEKLYPKALSGGMSQRAAIARALITDPNVLLLDEPFSALDQFTKMQLQDLVLKIQAKYQTTMIMVTHDIDEALYLADRIIILSDQPGTVKEIVTVTEKQPRRRGSEALAKRKQFILDALHI